ncbi:MAG: hypothetical protein QOD71_2098 [Thermoleophilaceae bacterium]|jgi:hypothetical protein|nr:hypothetical protein [Thermoleophilaceae bacterium]
MILAHIAGLPVEETLLSFAPLGLGAVAFSVRSRVSRWWRSRRLSRAP